MVLSLVLEFAYERATKGTFRFKEVTDGDPAVGVLYLRRHVFADDVPPEKIKVYIESTE